MINFTGEEKKLIKRRREIIESCPKISVSNLTEQQIKLLSLWEPGPQESDKNFKEKLYSIPKCETLEDTFRALLLNNIKRGGTLKPISLSEEEIKSSINHELGHSLILNEFFDRDPLFIIILGVEIDYGEEGILELSAEFYNNYPPDLYPKPSWKEPFLKYINLSIPPPLQHNYADLFIGLGGVAADVVFNNISKENIIEEINNKTRSQIPDIRKFFNIVKRYNLREIDTIKTVRFLNELIEIINSRRDYVIVNSRLLKNKGVLTNENFI
jgi:hypothetical protein